MEAAAFARQAFGQQQLPSFRIIAAQGAIEWHDADAQAVPPAQPLGDGVVKLGWGDV